MYSVERLRGEGVKKAFWKASRPIRNVASSNPLSFPKPKLSVYNTGKYI